jgi:hypothetical protein
MEICLAKIEELSGERRTPEGAALHRSNDLPALTVMLSSDNGILSYGFEDVVPTLRMPCLFYVSKAGDDPSFRACVERMPNARYVSPPALGRDDVLARSDLVLPHVRWFLAEVGVD